MSRNFALCSSSLEEDARRVVGVREVGVKSGATLSRIPTFDAAPVLVILPHN